MSVSSFKDISWGANEQLDTTKFNTMCANTRYLFERAPKLLFTAYGIRKDSGLKIACGVAAVPPSTGTWATVAVPFGSFFTEGSRPVITTGVHGTANGRVIATIQGYSGREWAPDHRGFYGHLCAAELVASQNRILKTTYLHWQAMCY